MDFANHEGIIVTNGIHRIGTTSEKQKVVIPPVGWYDVSVEMPKNGENTAVCREKHIFLLQK